MEPTLRWARREYAAGLDEKEKPHCIADIQQPTVVDVSRIWAVARQTFEKQEPQDQYGIGNVDATADVGVASTEK